MPGAPFDVAVLDRQPRGDGDVLEQSLAEIAIEGRDVVGEVRLEHVEQAVAVVVADRDTHARLGVAVLAVRRAALHGDVGERAVAVVAVQDRGRRVGRDVDVGPAVAVEVGRDGGHRVATRDGRDARRV